MIILQEAVEGDHSKYITQRTFFWVLEMKGPFTTTYLSVFIVIFENNVSFVPFLKHDIYDFDESKFRNDSGLIKILIILKCTTNKNIKKLVLTQNRNFRNVISIN